MQGSTPIDGTVTYAGNVGTFNPASNLANNTTYTATIKTLVMDLAGNALASDKVWSFTTVAAAGPTAVNLRTGINYVLLSKTGISSTGTTAIVGDIGVSPVAATFITGFGLIMDASNEFSSSSLITGRAYAATYTEPTPTNLTVAIGDMETAFTDAAGRTLPDATELGSGDISGLTITPGLYKWSTGVLVSSATDVTLNGGPNSVWIFQIAGDFVMNTGSRIILTGGALPENVFIQVSGQTTMEAASEFRGILLCQTMLEMKAGAVLEGRALVQTEVTLISNSITQP